ncbi:MAG TPA: hypothetical protein VGO80_11670 [Solirubrobacteraceae bacterium]|nr:hypothetical protein [Solirubrobacteraceae bacterium]
MTIVAGDDRLHLPAAPDAGFRDAVTFSFGDPAARLYGLARLSRGSDACNGLAVLYAGDQPVAADAAAGGAGAETWDSVQAAGVRVHTIAPLEAWSVRYAGDGAGFDLRFEACSAPAELAEDGEVARVGGMHGYDQLCRVTGTAGHGGQTTNVRCLGQRGQLWGNPDWSRIELARTVSAWLGEDRALTLTAVRPAKSKNHLDEVVSAFVFEDGEPAEIGEPRLSTTYDGEQRQRRAGLELWMDEEADHARRVGGEALCGTSLDLGEQRLESAFFQWRMEGRTGVGRYDVLRRAGGGGGRRRSR